MVKAVIFDMDDLMIESEMQHCKAYQKTLSELNIDFTEENYLDYCIGISDKDICRILVGKFSLVVSPEKLLERKNDLYRNEFMKNVLPKKGLMDLLVKLKEGKYLMAVASGSQMEEIEETLRNLKIEHYFKAVVSAEFVEKGKPAPDIFLLAANKMEIDPADCLVLEDAPSGLLGSKAAGMKCFVIPTEGTKNKDFSKADKILDSLDDVYSCLSQ